MNFRAYRFRPYAGVALALSLFSPVFAAPDVQSRLLTNSKADTSYRSCKTLIACVDILERHDNVSFDYAILSQDFDRFGEKSRQVLWRMIEAGQGGGADAETIADRALDILSRSPNILPPMEQRRITELWMDYAGAPYTPEFLARTMVTNLSPMARSAAIKTLANPNPDIAYYSREILAVTLQRQMKFPMIDADLAPLSRAALQTPSPVLTALVALYPAKTSMPILTQVLKSGDAPSVIEAYRALHKTDEEGAFKALMSILYKLQPQEAAAVAALGGLLSHRHPQRSDGFYMNFARDLLGDPKMSEAGRAVGFDALLRRQGEKNVPALSATPLSRNAFTLALSAFESRNIPQAYFGVPQAIGANDPDSWLRPLIAAAKTPQDNVALTEAAGNFDTPLAKTIAQNALRPGNDYRLTIAGILASTAQAQSNDTALAQQLATIKDSHPMTVVRAAAELAAEALRETSPRRAILKSQSELPRRAAALEPAAAFCAVAAADLRQLARPMPYYNPALLPGRVIADRAWLTSGARATGGWLAGYSHPSSGGLVQYNNQSGSGAELFEASLFGPQAVIAVQPTRQVPLGQIADAFWIFATSLKTGESAIYRAAQNSGGDITLVQHAVLPALPSAIELRPSGDISFAMGKVNPPLTLTSDGALRRSCAP